MPGIGATTAEGILDQLETVAGAASLAEVRVSPRAAEPWAGFVRLFELLQRGHRRLAGRDRGGAPLV